MILAKLTYEERALYEILRNPVWCGEFLYSIPLLETEPEYEFTIYQKLFLLDFSTQVSWRAGRAVGKTVALITKITWHAVNRFFDDLLYSVPNRSQLEPVFLGVQKAFRGNRLLSFWLSNRSVNSQTFLIKFTNLHTLICRIAGNTGTGVNVVGLHVPLILVDESGYYSWGTWVELQPVMNDWEPGHQMCVCGVPDGRRERSVCFQCDDDPAFSKHHTTAYENPRFTKEAENRAISQFGGKEGQDFIRQVLGEHGSPTYAVFDRSFMKLEDYHVPVLKLYGAQLKEDSQLPYRVVANLPKPPKYCDAVVLGIDLGYTEPSAIICLYLVDTVWYILFRLELYQINYNTQEKVFDLLDTKYNPAYIGIDAGAGGQGKSIVHNLINRDEYTDKSFGERLVPVEFAGTVVVGYDELGHELKERIKPFSVSKLQQTVNGHYIALSIRDEDLITELENITYTKSLSGNVIYKVRSTKGGNSGDDHNFAALLTFCMVMFEKYEHLTSKAKGKRLYGSKWLVQ